MVFPNFQLNEEEKDFYQYKNGQNAIVIFYRGKWCHHCRRQLQDFNSQLQSFEKLNTKIIGVSCDSRYDALLLKSFLRLNFSLASDPEFKLINELGIKTQYKDHDVSKPAIYLINKQNEIIYSYISDDYDDRLNSQSIIKKINSNNQ